jgi:hypothetical protein
VLLSFFDGALFVSSWFQIGKLACIARRVVVGGLVTSLELGAVGVEVWRWLEIGVTVRQSGSKPRGNLGVLVDWCVGRCDLQWGC